MLNLEVNLQQKKYSIIIKKGILENIGREIKKIYKKNKIIIITDQNVQRLYGKKIINALNKYNFETKTIVIKPGEESKSLESAKNIYEELLNFDITRKDMIIAFGGGVVGDLSGFVSSTLLRGIPYIQIPTSLLAQIDSSIGGKVAVNLSQGKNLVGSFYHPEVVYIDSDLLKTLNKRFLYDGMSEVIKYGCIKDKKLFSILEKIHSEEQLFNNIDEIIKKCCEIKRNIVEIDENDTGERMLLNFGHTIGHAIEKEFEFKKYSHGEAVAIGMYNMTRRSESMGLTKQGTAETIKRVLNKYNLPYEMQEINAISLEEIIKHDKKSEENNLNIILLKQIGESFIKKTDKKDISKYIN